MVFSISRWVVRTILRLFFGFHVDGLQHEPPSGPVIVVSNHVSGLDPLVVGVSLRRRVGFMAKEELFANPLLRWWMTACGAFSVRRGAPDRRALRTALALLSRGEILVMFPEGTRGHDRTLRPPEPGAALLAARTGAAILPLALLGTDEALPRDAHRLRRARIQVRIGPPLWAAGTGSRPGEGSRSEGAASGRAALDAIGARYMAEIARLLGTTP